MFLSNIFLADFAFFVCFVILLQELYNVKTIKMLDIYRHVKLTIIIILEPDRLDLSSRRQAPLISILHRNLLIF